MPRRIAVIDSSPLIGLMHLSLADRLTLFFDTIYVPRAVQGEVNVKARFRYRLRKLYQAGFFVRCLVADADNVGLLRAGESAIGAGEAEALIQAQEQAAAFFIADERRARDLAEKLGLTCVGTARLIARLSLEESAPDETRPRIQKLRRDLHFRIAEDVIEGAIAKASEPI